MSRSQRRLNHNGNSLLTSLIENPDRETFTWAWTISQRRLFRQATLVARSVPHGDLTALFAYFICNPAFLTNEVEGSLVSALQKQDLEGKSASLRIIFSPLVLKPTDNPWQDAWDAGIDQLRHLALGPSRRKEELEIAAAIGYSICNIETWFPTLVTPRAIDEPYITMAKEAIAGYDYCNQRLFGIFPWIRRKDEHNNN